MIHRTDLTVVRTAMVSIAAAALLALSAPLRAKADTGPRPVGGDAVVGGTFDPTSFIAPGLLMGGVALVAWLAIRRPGWRRPMAAMLTVLGAGLVAFVLVVGGLFSDFSGQHRTYPQLVIGGIVVLVLGLVVAVLIARGGRRSTTSN